jgi:hypothetical protein
MSHRLGIFGPIFGNVMWWVDTLKSNFGDGGASSNIEGESIWITSRAPFVAHATAAEAFVKCASSSMSVSDILFSGGGG